MTLEEAKAYLRIETAAEDALIAGLVASAIGVCEAFVGVALVRREIVEVLPASGGWRRLSAAPVHAITSVERIDEEGRAVALAPGGYAIDIDAGGDGWVRAGGTGRLRVTCVAGLAEEAAGVPAALAQGVIRLAAHLYTNRDDAKGPPAAVAALWRPFRRVRLGRERRA